MMNEQQFELYDADIRFLLQGKMPLAGVILQPTAAFENLQEVPLIEALYKQEYPLADHLLRRLTEPLSQQDAMAACLCALVGPVELMRTLLDHCPEIPSFQFHGVGTVSSLLTVAVDYDRHEMLNILLQRGADPNGDPAEKQEMSPLEIAFCYDKHKCLSYILNTEDLRPEVTERMLNHWGILQGSKSDNAESALIWWSAQLMMERLTGTSMNMDDPFPIPPQLRLEHALKHRNTELAAHICETRSLTEAEKDTVLNYYARCWDDDVLKDISNWYRNSYSRHSLRFLLRFLEQFPDTLNTPAMRFAVAAATMRLPEENARLQRWVEQLEDGPVRLKKFPVHQVCEPRMICSHPPFVLNQTFFPLWEARLGPRLIPAFDIQTDVSHYRLTAAEWTMLVTRVLFVGERSTEHLSPVAEIALRYAPEQLLQELLQPGKLLALEHPSALFKAIRDLPQSRCSVVLPHIHKTVQYDL